MVDFTVDEVNKLLIVDLPDTEVTIQQIVDFVREWQDELINEDIEDFINPSGKQDLGGGVYVGITLQFRYGWRLQFADRTGPAWILCTVKGGNLVGDGYFPVKESTFVNTVIAQSTSAALLSGGADPSIIADAVWDETLAGHVGVGSAGKAVSDTLTEITSVLGATIAAVGLTIAGCTTTMVRTNLTQADDFFDGMHIVVVNSAGVVARRIEQYLNTNGAFYLGEPLPFTPSVGDTVYVVMPTNFVYGRVV